MSSSPVVVVTGSSEGGIGSALCRSFHRSGCTVYASGRNLSKLEPLKDSGIRVLEMDVISQDSVDRAIEQVLEETGRIDILVNNAGMGYTSPVLDADLDAAMTAMNVNMFGTVRVAKTCGYHMAKRGKGQIINIGSVAGYASTPWAGFYSATKAAVHKVSDALRMELAPFNVKVTVVAPGATRSHFVDNQKPYEVKEGTLYTAATASIQKRLMLSQGSNSMPADQFADVLVSRALAGKLSNYFTYGPGSGIFTWLYYLPSWITDWIMSRIFELNKLGQTRS